MVTRCSGLYDGLVLKVSSLLAFMQKIWIRARNQLIGYEINLVSNGKICIGIYIYIYEPGFRLRGPLLPPYVYRFRSSLPSPPLPRYALTGPQQISRLNTNKQLEHKNQHIQFYRLFCMHRWMHALM